MSVGNQSNRLCNVPNKGNELSISQHKAWFDNLLQFFILHLINSSNERPLFVQRDRPIFSRIGSKKVRIIFVLDDSVQVHFTIVFQR